ncbi:MAG: hypothetical protein II918_07775 [Firmicutes bacterium]|nr:hypothetical protein [Bacillota bacterium]
MEKTTDYGKIKIADVVFEKMIKDALTLTEGRDELAEGKKSIIVEGNHEELHLEFHVIHMFGTSLRVSSKAVLDHMEKRIQALGLKKPVRVTMKVVAIRARRTQKRDLVFERTVK